MEKIEKIEKKLDKVFELIENKNLEIKDLKKIAATLYDELLKVKKLQYGKSKK